MELTRSSQTTSNMYDPLPSRRELCGLPTVALDDELTHVAFKQHRAVRSRRLACFPWTTSDC